jgi:hypothetical protein
MHTRAARTAALLTAGVSHPAEPAVGEPMRRGWERCACEVANSYNVRVDRGGRAGTLRYIAVARTLNVRPYAVITSDPAELLQALGCAEFSAAAAEDGR